MTQHICADYASSGYKVCHYDCVAVSCISRYFNKGYIHLYHLMITLSKVQILIFTKYFGHTMQGKAETHLSGMCARPIQSEIVPAILSPLSLRRVYFSQRRGCPRVLIFCMGS